MGGFRRVIRTAVEILEMPLEGQGVPKGRVIFPAQDATVVRDILYFRLKCVLEKTHLQFSDDK